MVFRRLAWAILAPVLLLALMAPGLGAQEQPPAAGAEAAPAGTGEGAFSTTDLPPPAPGPTPTPMPTPSAATPAAGGERPASPLGAFPGLDVVKALGAFILVIALLVICLKAIGWLGRGRRAAKGGQAFVLRGTMLLDGRRYLAAVEVDGHLLVVGVTPERLTSLASWPLPGEDGGGGLPDLPVRPRAQGAARPASRPPAGAPALGGPGLAVPGRQAPAAREPAGPGLGPGPGDGPGLDLSLDDERFAGPETNDDFLKLFQDDFGKK
jgi:flagellar biogenesis protein FliO